MYRLRLYVDPGRYLATIDVRTDDREVVRNAFRKGELPGFPKNFQIDGISHAIMEDLNSSEHPPRGTEILCRHEMSKSTTS